MSAYSELRDTCSQCGSEEPVPGYGVCGPCLRAFVAPMVEDLHYDDKYMRDLRSLDRMEAERARLRGQVMSLQGNLRTAQALLNQYEVACSAANLTDPVYLDARELRRAWDGHVRLLLDGLQPAPGVGPLPVAAVELTADLDAEALQALRAKLAALTPADIVDFAAAPSVTVETVWYRTERGLELVDQQLRRSGNEEGDDEP